MDDKRKPRPWSAKRAAVAMSNAPGWLDPQVAEQTIHERGGAEVITCNHGPKALCDVCRIDLQRYELDTMRANLAAMQARAEKAETDLAAARESVDHLSGLLTEERERAKALEARLTQADELLTAAKRMLDSPCLEGDISDWQNAMDQAGAEERGSVL